jgi:heme-degrading monooxygenase HmoA
MPTAEPFIALVIYPTTPDAQSRHAANLLRLVADAVRTMPGFVRSRVLLSEDGGSLVTFTEWRDRESFDRFRETDFSRAALSLVSGLDPRAYWLRPHATVEAP